jgi:ABC-type multidrug transport system fused ATPase/permease subunit
LLILDEATSALDHESEEIIQRILAELKVSGSVAMLIIAHRYSTIRSADQIYELRDGKAVLLGQWEHARKYLETEKQSLVRA